MARSVGRPSKLEPDAVERMVNAIRAGNTLDTACAVAGIRHKTMRNWIHAGVGQKRGKYRDFYSRIKKALAEAEAFHVTNITSVARGRPAQERRREEIAEDGTKTVIIERHGGQAPQWTASAWFLERRNPKRYSRTVRVEGGDESRPVVFAVKLDKTLATHATDPSDVEELEREATHANGNGRKRLLP